MQDQLHETNQYHDLAFPVGLYTVTPAGIVPEGRGYRDLHWHEELQYTMALEGEVLMQVNGKDYPLREGEAILINKNLLHITREMSENGRYFSINFPDRLLGFYAGSRMERNHVLPYTNNYLFPTFVLRRGAEEWHGEVLDRLLVIRELMLDEPEFYQYQVALALCEAWAEIISHVGTLEEPSKGYVRKQERMQQMLAYIHEHYMEGVLLGDIAGAASVSEGECCRCFRELIHESPNQYLLSYRIARAKELLTGTNLSVTDIAFECGFNDTSHFIQYFRKREKKTPYEYRKL